MKRMMIAGIAVAMSVLASAGTVRIVSTDEIPSVSNRTGTVQDRLVDVNTAIYAAKRGAPKGTKFLVVARAGVGHDSVVGDFANIAPGVSLSGHTTIGEDVFMGTNSCTAPGMSVGKGATVACGTPVLKNVEPGTVLSPFGTLKPSV